jgi:hypothetical protein
VNGNVLDDGDTVTVIEDLQVRGTPSSELLREGDPAGLSHWERPSAPATRGRCAISDAGRPAEETCSPALWRAPMPCRGLFLAITRDQADGLRRASDDQALMDVVGQLESAWDVDTLAQCDKSWGAMHRLLTDGSIEPRSSPHATAPLRPGAGPAAS